MTEYFKITTPEGEIEYEPVAGRAPSAMVREIRETRGPGFIVGMTTKPPVEILKAFGEATVPAVGEMVYVEHIGITKAGRVVKVGRTRVHVEIGVGRGTKFRTKIIVRPIHEVRR
jgi:hypothetical protein